MEILAVIPGILLAALAATVLSVVLAALVLGLLPEVLETLGHRGDRVLQVALRVLEPVVLVAVTVRALARLVVEKVKVMVVKATAAKENK